MSLYCLIHGSAHGPEGWGRVARELEQSGHEVVVPALPIGRPEASATEYVNAIGAAFDAAGADPIGAVAVGHSASGMFLPLVAARWRVRRMVFLAAIIPRVGISVMEQIRRDAAMFILIGSEKTRWKMMSPYTLNSTIAPKIGSTGRFRCEYRFMRNAQ